MKKCKKVINFPEVNYLIGNYRIMSFDGIANDYTIYITDIRNNYEASYLYFTRCGARKKLYKLLKELRQIDYDNYKKKNNWEDWSTEYFIYFKTVKTWLKLKIKLKNKENFL